MAQNFLESEGIETMLQDELTTQVNNFYSNAIGGVKLQTREKDYDHAIATLHKGGYIGDPGKKAKVEEVPISQTTNKKQCPFCHSVNIGKNKDADIITVMLYFILGAFFPIFRTSYTCFDCGKGWKYIKHVRHD